MSKVNIYKLVETYFSLIILFHLTQILSIVDALKLNLQIQGVNHLLLRSLLGIKVINLSPYFTYNTIVIIFYIQLFYNLYL
jgi:hypothetical protein